MYSIYFTGASSQGKSTMANLFAKEMNFRVIEGPSRICPFKPGSSEHQQWVSNKVYERSMFLDGVHTRTPLDVISYTRALNLYSPKDEQHAADWQMSNPIVIYFPRVLQTRADGYRYSDDINNRFDNLLRERLKYVNHYELKSLSIKDRLREISDFYVKEIIKYGSKKTSGQAKV